MTTQSTVYVTYIATTPEKRWAALTSSEFTRQYFFNRTVESDWKKGSPWILRMPDGRVDVKGEVREMTRNWSSPERRLRNSAQPSFPMIEPSAAVCSLTDRAPDLFPPICSKRAGAPKLSGLNRPRNRKAAEHSGAAATEGAAQMSKFVYVVHIRTTPEKLWDAMTKPEFTRAYWCETWQECDWKAGSPWRIMIPDGRVADSGEVLEIDRPHRLVLSWRNEFTEMKAEGYSRATFELEPVGDTVKLTTHEIDRDRSKLIDGVSGGWPTILSSLKASSKPGLRWSAGRGQCSRSHDDRRPRAVRKCRARSICKSLARPDSRFLDELCPLHRFGLEGGGERGGRVADRHHSDVGEPPAQLVLRKHPHGVAVDLVDDGGRRSGRDHQAE
jgi:uncharacterized protein YndB with AHSA1/START domain